VFRFDGSDQMPAAVGSNAYWKQVTSWITGQDTKTTVDNIEKAWPK
jgi:alpha-glucoside transport system substrate-binding protein